MSADFLKTMAVHKQALLDSQKPYYDDLRKNIVRGVRYDRYGIFRKAISSPGGINLIAEIKKASPSSGVIREDFDVLAIAKTYVDSKAAAISVLTEDKFFLGKMAYLKEVSEAFTVPTLIKDFIIDERQIVEASYHGASAVLLITAMLSNGRMKDLMQTAWELDLDCLVEVHDEWDLERALECNATIIGINNRDLHTLNVDLESCLRLIPLIPEGKVIVAESGFKTHDDVKRVRNAGAHAVLIGETFMAAPDIGQKIKEVMYGAR